MHTNSRHPIYSQVVKNLDYTVSFFSIDFPFFVSIVYFLCFRGFSYCHPIKAKFESFYVYIFCTGTGTILGYFGSSLYGNREKLKINWGNTQCLCPFKHFFAAYFEIFFNFLKRSSHISKNSLSNIFVYFFWY
jgi:hypothetical protein